MLAKKTTRWVYRHTERDPECHSSGNDLVAFRLQRWVILYEAQWKMSQRIKQWMHWQVRGGIKPLPLLLRKPTCLTTLRTIRGPRTKPRSGTYNKHHCSWVSRTMHYPAVICTKHGAHWKSSHTPSNTVPESSLTLQATWLMGQSFVTNDPVRGSDCICTRPTASTLFW